MRLCGWFCLWLYNLCADVFHMSCDLSWQGLQYCRTVAWEKSILIVDWLKVRSRKGYHYVHIHWIPPMQEFFRSLRRNPAADNGTTGASGGLSSNIPLPSTGEEAMHRLLACKGRDPYSILGYFFPFY